MMKGRGEMKKRWMAWILCMLVSLTACVGDKVQNVPQEYGGVSTNEEKSDSSSQKQNSPKKKSDAQTKEEQGSKSKDSSKDMSKPDSAQNTDNGIAKEGEYSSKEEVALYLHTYGHLPSNYITKKEAQSLGWDNKKGNLWDVANGKSIGGDRFGNREKKLPDAKNRQWYECDIDYQGGFRNEKRIVFSNDGWIFYTGDHYKSFDKLYEGK